VFARALRLLLLVLNAGVASWWILRPDPAPPSPAAAPPGPRLLRVGEAAPAAASAAAHSAPMTTRVASASPSIDASPSAASTVVATVSAVDANATEATPAAAAAASAQESETCVRFGPYPSQAAAAQARAALPLQVTRSLLSDTSAGQRGWHVWLPALPDHAAAQAMAARIAAAGFDDYYVIPDGADANSIALGRYGNAQAAQRRQAALKAAGFDAQAAALGTPAVWLLVAAPRGFDADAASAAVGAAQHQPIACTALHSPPARRPR
jgi:hypothetical protein